MRSNCLVAAALLVSGLLATGCSRAPESPTGPASIGVASLAAKPEGKGGDTGGGNKLVGDVVAGEHPFATGDATALASTCPAAAGTTWGLDFAHSQCLIVRPDWNPASAYEPYALTDDVKILTLKENGARGRITHVRLIGQDVIGAEGIQHNTDWVPVAVPIVPDKKGGTLHVHAANIEVWRLSGHTDGSRVALIGWISIGDLVYR